METENKLGITFTAIKEFVVDLAEVFCLHNKPSPLALYHRLISHVEVNDSSAGVDKYIMGFKVFFSNFESNLESEDKLLEIPQGTVIRYGDSPKVYLEIQKYIYISRFKPDQLEVIRTHLLTIAATIDPNEKTLAALDGANILEKLGKGARSAETNFIRDIMEKTKKTMANMEIDHNDPSAAITAVLSSGLLQDVISGLQSGCENKTINTESLMSDLAGTIAEASGGEVNGDDISKIIFATQNAMSGVKNSGGATIEEVIEDVMEDVQKGGSSQVKDGGVD
jgi:hypothetical protein